MSANGVNGTLPSVEEQLRIRRERLAGTINNLTHRCRSNRLQLIISGRCIECKVLLINSVRYYRLLCIKCRDRQRDVSRVSGSEQRCNRKRRDKNRNDERYRIYSLWEVKKCITPFPYVWQRYELAKVCDCCGNDFPVLTKRGPHKSLSGIDKNLEHNHTTLEFRGWVCTPCNIVSGYIDKGLDIHKVVAYLAKPRPKFEPALELPLELFS